MKRFELLTDIKYDCVVIKCIVYTQQKIIPSKILEVGLQRTICLNVTFDLFKCITCTEAFFDVTHVFKECLHP